MPKKENEKTDGKAGRSLRWMGPLLLDIINAWRDRPRWEEILDDLEAVARENERLMHRVRVLTAIIAVLALWVILITFFLVLKTRAIG